MVVADQAFSVALNPEHEPLVAAATDACEAALQMIAPKVKTNAIGKIVEGIIKKAGFASVRELSGHQLSQYELHSGINIPNIALPTGKIIEENQVFAIETFASTGTGHVHDRPYVYIYSYQPERRGAIRQALIARSTMQAEAAGAGLIGTSAYGGGRGAVGAQLGANLGFGSMMSGLGQQYTGFTAQAARYQGQAQLGSAVAGFAMQAMPYSSQIGNTLGAAVGIPKVGQINFS